MTFLPIGVLCIIFTLTSDMSNEPVDKKDKKDDIIDDEHGERYT
jgi:hypothetical protein